MNYDLTKGRITGSLLKFSFPLILGNLLQQCYNLADTLIVGKFVGADALAAVGSAYSLMTFVTSIIIGLCIGAGAYFSHMFGCKNEENLKTGIFISFSFIGVLSFILNILLYIFCDPIMRLLQVPDDIFYLMKDYLMWVFAGMTAVFVYNFFSNLLRGIGNSFVPLIFLCVSAVLNIGLDIVFVLVFENGIAGVAIATVISQVVSGVGLALFTLIKFPKLRIRRRHLHFDYEIFKNIASLSFVTCLQQSVMNFGILLVQGIVNGFGKVVMAAFAAGVKIDTLAYMPVQDFGNAFSTFVAQNYGAGKEKRICQGIKSSVICVTVFCIVISAVVCVFARPLMSVFVQDGLEDVIAVGVQYLTVEGTFYIGIGILFMLYGYYRAVNKPFMSLVLTLISLGVRVVLAYFLSKLPSVGVFGIWVSVPVGWALADITGIVYYFMLKRKSKLRKTTS